MSLTGSLYSGITGLTAHSQAISVVGNNLANTSTIGFKGSTVHFEDLFYSYVHTASGVDQTGHGVATAAIMTDYSQGPYEASSEVTDMALGGEGFFTVRDALTGDEYYTRAGNFRFDNDGYLVTPAGYRVQGWEVVDGESTSTGLTQITGTPGDIRLENFQSPPEATSAVSFVLNLDSDSDDNAAVPTDPFFSMFQYWDGTEDTPLADSRYAYQTTISVYDENGTATDLTVYFDPVNDSTVASQAGGFQVWEYMVTVPPTADGRTLDGQSIGTTSAGGVLMVGTLTFNTSGNLVGQSAFTLNSGASGDMKDLSNWSLAEFSDDGLPIMTANFSGASNASATNQTSATSFSIDFGLSTGDPLTNGGWATGSVSNASLIGNTYSSLPNMDALDIAADATTSYDTSSTTLTQSQDGYAAGFLQSLSVNSDGVITGNYSNGQVLDLYAVTLSRFDNQNGLEHEGGNLFSATRDSGQAITGTANTSTFGSVAANTLEQSNVDTATEMVRLITLQRGFQSNSKVITTADTLLGEVIALKR